MDGILNINKPTGKTSFDIVALVRRLFRQKQVGHAGTLDPAAGGVLPVCLGRATRLTEYLQESHKTYRAEIMIGVETDTYDAEGTVIARHNASNITRQDIVNALEPFRGQISQTPPMYSAVKQHGQPLYKLARRGVEVERQSRPAQVYRLELLAWQSPLATVEVECGKGTYIRSLAHDLGAALACGASLAALVRMRYGPLGIEDAASPEQLEAATKQGTLSSFVRAMDSVLADWPAVSVSTEDAAGIMNGVPQPLPDLASPADGARCRVYADRRFLAILRFVPETGLWQPEKVFPEHQPGAPGPG